MRGFDCSSLRQRQSLDSFEHNFKTLFKHLSIDDVLAAGTSEPFRDGWIAIHFAQATSAAELWLTSKGHHDDFFVSQSGDPPIAFQATEALAPGRRRGDERRQHRDRIRQISQEEMEAEERAAGSTLLSACDRKLFAKNSRVVVYWNFATFGPDGFDDEIASCLKALIGPCFEELWLIRHPRLLKIHSNYWGA
jgi:hypothetical protein